MAPPINALRCTSCEEPLDAEEALTPRTVPGQADLLCDECYREEFTFSCAWCDEDSTLDEQHRYVAVFDAEAVAAPLSGFYRVNKAPYYTQPLLGPGWLHPWAVTWLGFLPPACDADHGYPCGHFCAMCQEHAFAYITWTRCCQMAALP